MDIIVCIKQVPDARHVDIDSETGNLIREGVDSQVNIYDLHALEYAIKLRESLGGTITALCMGPPQAKQALQEMLMLGADKALLVSDRAFAGSDVLATSYTLYQAILTLDHFDLIICGKQTTDGDTAQVGPALAEFLNLPHAAWVTTILDASPLAITVRQDLGETLLEVRIAYPGLITVEQLKTAPRLPSYQRKKQFCTTEIPTLTLSDLPDKDPNNYGSKGSPTQVERIFPPPTNTTKTLLTGSSAELAKEIYQVLLTKKYLTGD